MTKEVDKLAFIVYISYHFINSKWKILCILFISVEDPQKKNPSKYSNPQNISCWFCFQKLQTIKKNLKFFSLSFLIILLLTANQLAHICNYKSLVFLFHSVYTLAWNFWFLSHYLPPQQVTNLVIKPCYEVLYLMIYIAESYVYETIQIKPKCYITFFFSQAINIC